MIQNIRFYRLGFFVVLVSMYIGKGCSKEPRPEKIDHKKIDIRTSGKTVNFCKAVPFEWDSILVIRPYMQKEKWERFQLKNIDPIQDELAVMESVDWLNYLVFIKEQNVIAYAEVPRGYVDFKVDEPASSQPFINKKNCVLQVFKKFRNPVLIVPAMRSFE